MPATKVPSGTRMKRWTIKGKLGEGAFGEVYGATGDDGIEYAIKIVPIAAKKKRSKSSQSQAATLLSKERNYYQNLFRQGHENMAKVPRDGYFEVDGLRCLVMPRLGDTLSGVLKKRGAFSPPNLALCATQVVRALQFLHSKQYVYRDVKPDNFMLGSDDAPDRVYIIDFGCTDREFLHNGSRQPPSENGTPTYFSLNTHDGESPSPRDDLEGAGYMFVQLATGSLPWESAASLADLHQRKANLPLANLCSDCPDAVRAYLEYVRGLAIDDNIDYGYLLGLFDGLVPKSRAFAWDAPAAPKRSTARVAKRTVTRRKAAAKPTKAKRTRASRATKAAEAAETVDTPSNPLATGGSGSANPIAMSSGKENLGREKPAPKRRTRRRQQTIATEVEPNVASPASPSDDEDRASSVVAANTRRTRRTRRLYTTTLAAGAGVGADAGTLLSPMAKPARSARSTRRTRATRRSTRRTIALEAEAGDGQEAVDRSPTRLTGRKRAPPASPEPQSPASDQSSPIALLSDHDESMDEAANSASDSGEGNASSDGSASSESEAEEPVRRVRPRRSSRVRALANVGVAIAGGVLGCVGSMVYQNMVLGGDM